MLGVIVLYYDLQMLTARRPWMNTCLEDAVEMPSLTLVVNGRERQLPEKALAEGCSDLMLSRGEYLSLEDYTASVAAVLSALEKCGSLTFRSRPQTRN
jgi:hypothetical protein